MSGKKTKSLKGSAQNNPHYKCGNIQANSKAGKAAEKAVAQNFESQQLGYQEKVSLDHGTTRAVADGVIQGPPNGVVQVPPGFVAEDLDGNRIIDKNTGKPITSFQLDAYGRTVVEVKTGEAVLSDNQDEVYKKLDPGYNGLKAGVTSNVRGTGPGTRAAGIRMSGPLPTTPVIVLRKFP